MRAQAADKRAHNAIHHDAATPARSDPPCHAAARRDACSAFERRPAERASTTTPLAAALRASPRTSESRHALSAVRADESWRKTSRDLGEVFGPALRPRRRDRAPCTAGCRGPEVREPHAVRLERERVARRAVRTSMSPRARAWMRAGYRNSQSARWSFTSPAACISAYAVVGPTKRNPRRRSSLASASDSGVAAASWSPLAAGWRRCGRARSATAARRASRRARAGVRRDRVRDRRLDLAAVADDRRVGESDMRAARMSNTTSRTADLGAPPWSRPPRHGPSAPSGAMRVRRSGSVSPETCSVGVRVTAGFGRDAGPACGVSGANPGRVPRHAGASPRMRGGQPRAQRSRRCALSGSRRALAAVRATT
jgi:hypothetical protein